MDGGSRLTDAQVVAVRERYAAGARQVDLAAQFGISQNTVSSLVTGRSRRKVGGPLTRGRASKLSVDDVIAIRTQAAEGASRRALAETYAVTKAMIDNVVTGVAHRDVAGPLVSAPVTRRHASITVEQVDDVKERIARGESRASIAASIGISVVSVGAVVRGDATGVPSEAPRSGASEHVEAIREAYAAGVTQTALAEPYGVSQSTIGNIVRGKVYAAEGGPIADRKVSVLPADTVRQIREAFAADVSVDDLASQFDRTSPVIRLLVTGASYPLAPGPTFAIDVHGRRLHATS